MNKKMIFFFITAMVLTGVITPRSEGGWGIFKSKKADIKSNVTAETKPTKQPQVTQQQVPEVVEKIETAVEPTNPKEIAEKVAEERRLKIVNLTVQARTKLIKGEYQKVVDMAQEILSLDPEHREAKTLIEKASAKLSGTAQ